MLDYRHLSITVKVLNFNKRLIESLYKSSSSETEDGLSIPFVRLVLEKGQPIHH